MPQTELVADGVWVLPLRTPTLPPATTTNTMLVVGDRVAVIEPATPHADERSRLDERIDALTSGGGSVAGIFLTHHHSDHVGYAAALRSRTGAPIITHEATARRVDFDVDRTMVDGERFELGGRSLVATHTPGHAPGHLCFADSRTRVVHVGDMVAGEGTILIDPRDDGDLQQYLDSLRAMRACLDPGGAWDAARFVPAHGPVLDDPVAIIEHYVRHRLGRERRLIEAFGERTMLAMPDLLARTYDDVPAEVLPIARWSLEAHLVKLEREGRVRRDGELVFLREVGA